MKPELRTVRPGMIVSLAPNWNERYEVLEVIGQEKILLRREDLEAAASAGQSPTLSEKERDEP